MTSLLFGDTKEETPMGDGVSSKEAQVATASMDRSVCDWPSEDSSWRWPPPPWNNAPQGVSSTSAEAASEVGERGDVTEDESQVRSCCSSFDCCCCPHHKFSLLGDRY